MAEATAQMMRTCVLAATRPWTDSTLRGLSLWSDMILASGRANYVDALSRALVGQDTTREAYASFRSGDGHASAQVIVAREGVPAQPFNAVAGLGPLYDMLDAWRAAFGAGQRS